MNLIPSPLRRDMVPGVAGERIVSKLRVLPKIDTAKESQVNRMKAIPERHGNATGTYTFYFVVIESKKIRNNQTGI